MGPPGADDVVARTLASLRRLFGTPSPQAVEDGEGEQSLDVARREPAEADAVRRGHDEPGEGGEDPPGRDVDPEGPRLLPSAHEAADPLVGGGREIEQIRLDPTGGQAARRAVKRPSVRVSDSARPKVSLRPAAVRTSSAAPAATTSPSRSSSAWV